MKILSERQIENRINKIKALEAEIKELEVELDSIKDELKADMRCKDVEEVATPNFTVRYKTIISNRFDSTAFKKAEPKMYEAYVKSSESRRFTIV